MSRDDSDTARDIAIVEKGDQGEDRQHRRESRPSENVLASPRRLPVGKLTNARCG